MVTLFRQEALDAKLVSPLGSIVLVKSRTTFTLTIVSISIVVCVVALIFVIEWSRHVKVFGQTRLELGPSRAAAPFSGLVRDVLVREGQQVVAGQPLLVVTGAHAAREPQAKEALHAKLTSLEREIRAHKQLATRQGENLKRRVARIRAELDRIGNAIELQRGKLPSQSELVVEHGPTLNDLEKQRLAAIRDLAENEHELAELPFRLALAVESLSRSSLQVRQELTELEGQSATEVLASRTGTVTEVLVTEGQQVVAATPLTTIAPASSKLVVQLTAPNSAIAYVKPGQRLNLRFANFPYRKFGQYAATIRSISKVPQQASFPALTGPFVVPDSAFRITASLDAEFAEASGLKHPFLPGMSVESDLELERKPIVQWLFERARSTFTSQVHTAKS